MFVVRCVLLLLVMVVSFESSAHYLKIKGVEIEEIRSRYKSPNDRLEIIFKAMPPATDVVIINSDGSDGAMDTWSCASGVSDRKAGRKQDEYAARLLSMALSAQAQGLPVDLIVEDSANCSSSTGGYLHGISIRTP